MTRQEFYDKYGEVKVKFSNYYKFTFYYSGVTEDGLTVSVGYGGDADEIYRWEVDNSETTVSQVWPYSGSVYKDGVEIDSFYDY